MNRYETLVLARSEITGDDLSLIERHIEKLVTEGKGSLKSFDQWGKCRLAYPVNKNNYGVYCLARFDLPSETVKSVLDELNSFIKIKCHETVTRYTTVKLAKNAPDDYMRPETVAASRTSTLDQSKIKNLLNTVDNAPAEKTAAQATSKSEPKAEEHVEQEIKSVSE